MAKPTLYVFAISHYCEKARWALDYLDIDYELRHLAPGAHRKVARELGVSGSSVPILETAERSVQGSANIIDWAEKAASKSLTPDGAREIENRLDDVVGIHVRRYYYSEALVDDPKSVRSIFIKDLPAVQKLLVSLQWPVICKLMIAGMDLGADQREQSKQVVEEELNWLTSLLSDGRPHLVGDQFSRADLTAASLFGPLATPPEHPVYATLHLPPKLTADMEKWERHPSISWVRDIYRQYRQT